MTAALLSTGLDMHDASSHRACQKFSSRGRPAWVERLMLKGFLGLHVGIASVSGKSRDLQAA